MQKFNQTKMFTDAGKMLESTKNIVKNNKKIVYIIAIAILLLLIGWNVVSMMKPKEVVKTNMQILVEKQQNNIEIIGVKMEAQKELRKQISDLQSKLDVNVNEVKDIEAINSQIRDEMIKEANNLSLTWSNE